MPENFELDIPRLTERFQGFRVLVVEDVLLNQKVAVNMLELFGCSVDVASNGIEAIQALQGESFDLVFMDCRMPEMDGLRATQQRRAEEHTNRQRRVPIIGLTASALEGDRDKCLAAGMDDYMSKPFILEQIVEKLDTWLPGRE